MKGHAIRHERARDASTPDDAALSLPIAPEPPDEPPAHPGMLYSFRFRDFRLLWAALVFRASAQWMDQVIRPVLIFELTDSAFLVGAVVAARMAPNFVLGLFAGTVVDRYPRRNVLIASQTLNAVASVALVPLLLAGTIEAWHVIALVSLQGVNIAFFQPARQAILPSLVPREALRGAIAMSQTAQHSMRIVGGVASGVLLALTSFQVIYALIAALYVIAVLTLLLIRSDTRPAAPTTSGIWRSTVEGARWAARTRRPLVVLLVGSVLFMVIIPYQMVFLPLLVIEELDLNRAWVGYLASATGVGAIIGAMSIAAVRTLPNPGVLMLGLLALSGLLVIALGAAPWLALTVLVLVLIGGSNVAFMSINNLTMLSLAPPEMSGRAMSLMNFARGLIPIGALIAGALADSIGARAGLLTMGLIALAVTGLVVLLVPAARRL